MFKKFINFMTSRNIWFDVFFATFFMLYLIFVCVGQIAVNPLLIILAVLFVIHDGWNIIKYIRDKKNHKSS